MLALTAVLCIWIRPASDDFYYITFGDGGWSAFVENNLEHYRIMSGRVFVHLVLYPLLCLDMAPFRVFALVLIGGLSVVMARLAADAPGDRPRAKAAALGIFWLMGIETLQDGALWGAGTMNYLFPVTLVLVYALLMQRILDGRGSLWLGIPAFFCASTVEMTGILPIVVWLYLVVTQWDKTRTHWRRVFAVGICTLAGYLFLFSSPGVAGRIQNNSAELSLWEKMLVNYALIDRKVIGPEGIWVVTTLTLACAGLVLRRAKPVWGMGMVLLSVAVVLTGLGVIYDGRAVALIAILAFAALAAFAVWSFLGGERQIPLWMLCATASLGVCLISPVMGSRLVIPTAVFLSVIFLRCFVTLTDSRRWAVGVTALMTAAACVTLVCYCGGLARNARVIDENARVVEAYTDGVLVQELLPDERFSGPAVPTISGFEVSYLRHHDLLGVKCAVEDPTMANVTCGGRLLPQQAVLRDGLYYIHVRAAAEAVGADVRWELASAVVETDAETYCFHLGDEVANLGHGITGSVKLSGPVRNIGGKIYIPVSDFPMLFGVELTVVPME